MAVRPTSWIMKLVGCLDNEARPLLRRFCVGFSDAKAALLKEMEQRKIRVSRERQTDKKEEKQISHIAKK